MRFPDRDRDATIKRYAERYRSHGYSPKSLGWDKGKQQLRFEILTSQYDFRGQHVLDIGCGFGDLNRTLAEKYGEHYRYTGIELVPDLLNEAVRRYERAGSVLSRVIFFRPRNAADGTSRSPPVSSIID